MFEDHKVGIRFTKMRVAVPALKLEIRPGILLQLLDEMDELATSQKAQEWLHARQIPSQDQFYWQS